MNVIKIYYYLFYKFYKFFKTIEPTALCNVKAGIIVMALEIWFLFSLNNYLDFFLNSHSYLNFFSFKILVPLSIVVIAKWFAFSKDNNWTKYVAEFDNWPKKKNKKGSWLVFLFVVFTVANLIFSYFLNPPPGGARW